MLSYMRNALLAKRRVLMTDWADFCGKTRADVVRMNMVRHGTGRKL
jgi:hypothetical protein